MSNLYPKRSVPTNERLVGTDETKEPARMPTNILVRPVKTPPMTPIKGGGK